MIKRSIFRQGGTINWNTTYKEIVNQFSQKSDRKYQTIEITAGTKGSGKSTVFEYLSQFAPGISVEGDIIGMTALALSHGHTIDLRWTPSDLSKGIAIPNYSPWSGKRFKENVYKACLTKFLGSNYNEKISLATSFHGGNIKGCLFVVPDYEFYSRNYAIRTAAMLADKTSSDAFREHVRKVHKVESFKEFSKQHYDRLKAVQGYDIPIAFVINDSPEYLETYALESIKTLLESLDQRDSWPKLP